MRFFIRFTFVLLLAAPALAATLKVEVNRNGFTGPIEIAVAPRLDKGVPQWSAPKTLTGRTSAASFTGLEEGLYLVIARGPEPLQRLSAKANLGTQGSSLRLEVPKSRTALRVTLAGQPLAAAKVSFMHESRWSMELTTDEQGRFEGAVWEPGPYTSQVWQDPTAAPYFADFAIDALTGSAKPLTIDVPDRHVTGRVLDDDGKALEGALVLLRTENADGTLSMRTRSAPDGHFEFFGVREGVHTLTARAPSHLDSDAVTFELHGASAQKASELKLTHGVPRAVLVTDERGTPIAQASLFTACDGHVKSTTVTNAEGSANVAMPASGACVVYALPKDGSIAAERVQGSGELRMRVRAGTSSLRLVLKSDAGEVFPDVWLLMRVNGTVVPPAILRQLAGRGMSLITDTEGSISLAHIPPGTYEFWPYRSEAEGRMLYEVAGDFAAPISVNVLTGENNATIRFKAR